MKLTRSIIREIIYEQLTLKTRDKGSWQGWGSESEDEDMSESKPKPYTLKFRGRDANKNGHLDFLLKKLFFQNLFR